MRRLAVLAVLAAIVVVLVSMAWGFRVLHADVPLIDVGPTQLSCGSVATSLTGDPIYGGEQPYPPDWTDVCRDAAKDQVGWIAVPAVAGPAALLFLGWTTVAAARRSRPETSFSHAGAR